MLNNLSKYGENTERMPVVFVGHGSPMNAIEDNEFSRSWQKLSQNILQPKAILCVSAHWETYGTSVTAMEHPSTIHDFGGFPRELYNVQYPAKGSPALANELIKNVKSHIVQADLNDWGLDHGTWSVLRHIYPDANIPVLQLSLNRNLKPSEHYSLASELHALRHKGVLIMGSGNMVHNLRLVDWRNQDNAYTWATEANETMKNHILSGNHKALINFDTQGEAFRLSIPTAEHFLPLLYVLGLQQKDEQLTFFNDKLLMGSLSMTGLIIG